MLVLGRKAGESIDLIDRETGKCIARVYYQNDRGNGSVGIGVEASKSIAILRTELLYGNRKDSNHGIDGSEVGSEIE